MHKLVIGTAQFGLDYGVSNHKGKLSSAMVTKILDYAVTKNICMLDTAASYGVAEQEIGLYQSRKSTQLTIISKISFQKICTEINALELKQANTRINHLVLKAVKTTLTNTGSQSLYAMLAHHADELLSKNGDGYYAALQYLKAQALVNKIGVSVYSPEQALAIIRNYDIDLIQIPINLFDQRAIHSGLLDELKTKKIEVHARSIFLQGLLTEVESKLNRYFLSYRPLIRRFQQLIQQHQLDPVQACLNFIYGLEQIDHIVVGVLSLQQLKQIVNSDNKFLSPELVRDLSSTDPRLINPSLWQLS